jgi:hypothetical protein
MPRAILYPRANARSGGTEPTLVEKHIIGEHESGWVFTAEIPLEEAPSSVSIPGFTEVTTGSPATGQFDVAYDAVDDTPETRGGAIKFNAANDGTEVTITYKGRGTRVSAGMFNDLQKIVGPWNINLPKAVADTPDDEFDGSSLAGKWTAVTGSAGTVSLVSTMQVGDNSVAKTVELRQDYTLPDGKSILAAVTATVLADTGHTTDEMRAALALNDTDSSFASGVNTRLWAMKVQASNAFEIALYNGTTLIGRTTTEAMLGQRVYLRLHRSGTTYFGFYSFDGTMWVPLGSHAAGAAHSNVWIVGQSAAAFTGVRPIQAFHWVRQGGSGVFPW